MELLPRIRAFYFALDRRDIPYIADMALYLPVLVLIHLWMLFSPDSEYWILSVPCFALRYGGSLFLFGTLNYTRSQILCLYVLAMPFLFVGSVINSWQHIVQNLAYGEYTFQCNRLLLAIFVFFIFILLYINPRIIVFPWWYTVAILVLISFVFLPRWTIVVYFVYWSSILIFTAIALWDVIKSADQVSRNVGQNEDSLLQYVAAFITNRFTKFPFCHIFSLFCSSYYTYAVICEFHNGMPLQALVSMPTLIHIMGKWCTSFIVLNSILSVLILIGNIVIITIRYCLINQREDRQWLRQLIYTGKANGIWIYFHTFAVRVDFMNLNDEKRGDVLGALFQFTLVGFLIVIWDMLKPFLTQLGAHAAERQLRVYIGVVTFIMSFTMVPILVSLNIANQYELEIWSVLCITGCNGLVFRAILTLMEYTVNVISWFYDVDLLRTQDIIYYISLSRSIGIIIFLILEHYYLLFFPLFSQNIFRLIVFAIISVFALIFFTILIVLSEYIRHVQKTESHTVVKSFPTATPEQLSNLDDVCAICMDEIHDGLVTPCAHIFHRECLRRACAIRQSCPVCNQLIFQTANANINIRDQQELLNELLVIVNRTLQFLG